MKKLIMAIICVVCTLPLVAQDSTRSPVQQIGKNRFRIGSAIINSAAKTITIPAQVNMNRGLIEVLLCTRAGKTHESLLTTDCSPTHLQLALITLGFTPIIDVDSVRSNALPDSFLIFFEWQENDRQLRHRAEDLIWNAATKKPMQRTTWKFIGSPVYPDGQLAAEFEGTLICTYEMHTILENGLATRYDDTLYYVNEKTTPPAGTKLNVIIQPFPFKGEPTR